MAASPATVPGETIGSMVNKAAVFEAMLRSGGWLATLPEAVRQAVFKASSVRTIAPGAALFEQDGRSEEHTSELQSLMRISYAVFCLKKKNTKIHERYTILTQQV